MVNAFLDFAGQALTFGFTGAGVSVDPATGQVTIPGDALLAGIEVTVTAANSGGSAVSRFRLTVAAVAPVVEPPASVAAPMLAGTGVIGAGVEVDPGQWSGQPTPELALQWRAGGVAIPGATGARFVPTPAEDGADLDCLVTATNAGGSLALVAGPRRVTEAPPVALGAIAPLALTLGGAPGRVEAAGHFAGGGLSFSVAGAGAVIDAASGVISVPAGELLAEEPVVVTARNSGGSATVVFRVSVAPAPVLPAAPTAQGALPELVFEQGGAARTVSTQAGFSGEELVFALATAPAGVTIESGSGLVRIPTDVLIPRTTVTVRASNAGGAAEQSFAVTVRSTVSVFDTAATLRDVRPLSYTAPAWTQQPEGYARLVPVPQGRTHGAWSKALGDGRYRCLARWSAAAINQAGARPFSFNARLVKTDTGGWAGLKVDALQPSAAVRQLEIGQYSGVDTKSTALAMASVGWQWNTWYWIEMEIDGISVKARLYPEAAAAAPDWQVTATTTYTAPGAFGPGGFPLLAGGPNIDIKRLEFIPLIQGFESIPPAAQDADWSLGQFTESK